MAKKKQDTLNDFKRFSTTRKILGFFTLSPVWQLLLTATIVGVLIWQWGNITDWYLDNVFTLFGWGILIVVGVVGTFVTIVLRRQLYLFKDYWNRWLSALFLLLATWGILAYFPGKEALVGIGLGGKFGLGVLGGSFHPSTTLTSGDSPYFFHTS